MKRLVATFLLASSVCLGAQDLDVAKRLEGFDGYMAKVLQDWNGPGIGVGVVVGDKLVFAKGYGYRDYEKKLPFTPRHGLSDRLEHEAVHAIAAGMLVEEGKLTWDQPVRESVPTIRFLQRAIEQHRDAARHAVAPHGITRHRHHLVQVRLHPQGALRSAEVPGAAGADAADLPVQQPDVRRASAT
jgi:CubicO group peptidase (beta-lactamase class C family)